MNVVRNTPKKNLKQVYKKNNYLLIYVVLLAAHISVPLNIFREENSSYIANFYDVCIFAYFSVCVLTSIQMRECEKLNKLICVK